MNNHIGKKVADTFGKKGYISKMSDSSRLHAGEYRTWRRVITDLYSSIDKIGSRALKDLKGGVLSFATSTFSNLLDTHGELNKRWLIGTLLDTVSGVLIGDASTLIATSAMAALFAAAPVQITGLAVVGLGMIETASYNYLDDRLKFKDKLASSI